MQPLAQSMVQRTSIIDVLRVRWRDIQHCRTQATSCQYGIVTIVLVLKGIQCNKRLCGKFEQYMLWAKEQQQSCSKHTAVSQCVL